MSTSREQQVLETVYSAPFDRFAWTKALSAVGSTINASSAALFSADSATDVAYTHVHNHSPDMAEGFLNYWHAHDLWAAGARSARVAPGQIVTGSELVPDTQFVRSAFYGDFLRHHGMERMIGTMLFTGSEQEMPFTHVCWYRSKGAADFSDQDKRQLRQLSCHFQRALTLQRRLSWFVRDARSAAIEAMYVASFVLDRAATIRHCNPSAAALLRDPQACSVRLGKLRGVGQACTPSVADALALCTPTNPVGIAAYFPAHKQVAPCTLFSLEISSPVDGQAGSAEGAYMLLIELPRCGGRRVAKSVAPLFRLTPAETRVMGELLVGNSPAAIADLCGSSVATVRTQMSSIFVKTGTQSQTDLLLLLRSMRF